MLCEVCKKNQEVCRLFVDNVEPYRSKFDGKVRFNEWSFIPPNDEIALCKDCHKPVTDELVKLGGFMPQWRRDELRGGRL